MILRNGVADTACPIRVIGAGAWANLRASWTRAAAFKAHRFTSAWAEKIPNASTKPFILAMKAGAPAGITGTAAVAFAVSLPEAQGLETFSGTAAVAFAVTLPDGTGVETFTGTAAEAFAVTLPEASGAETFTGEIAAAFGVTEPLAEGDVPVQTQPAGRRYRRPAPRVLPPAIVGRAAVTFRVMRVRAEGDVIEEAGGLELMDEMELELV